MAKINIFLPGSSVIYGGPVQSSRNISQMLISDGHCVNYFTQFLTSEESALPSGANLFIKEFNKKSLFYKIGLFALFQTGRMSGGDIVLLNGVWHPFYLFALLASRLKRIRRVYLFPRGSLSSYVMGRKSPLKILFFALFRRLCVDVEIIATSELEKSDVLRYFPVNKIHVIPNLIETHHFQPTVVHKRKKVIFVGRLHETKSVLDLVQAIKELPDLELDIVGDLRTEYGQLVKEYVVNNKLCSRILFRGHLNHRDTIDCIASARYLILPSKSENFANVIMEAFSLGVPVITTRFTPWGDVEKLNIGFLCEPNQNSLINILKTSSSLSNDAYEQMATASQNYYLTNFSRDIVYQKIKRALML